MSRSFALLFLLAFSLAAAPPSLRLDDAIRPVRYTADLTLLTDASEFKGAIDIEVELQKPASYIWLNASGITIRSASAKGMSAAADSGADNFIGLRFPSDLPKGRSALHIEYTGKISDRNTAGIFRSTEGGEKYLFTQFESTDARRAFPCFDQPDFKTPWQVTLHVRQEHIAISNTRVVSETAEPNGMKRVAFAPTRPLPSYLVAMAVGRFDIVDAGAAGRNRVPVRIVTPKGKAAQAKYAAEVTGPIIEQLERYFGLPFPYEKADQVAIPLTFGFGAMENAGLVTYSQRLILADPAIDTPNRQREYASVAAHELAHQWFGDLVTLAWWDDTWLNEAFATWASSKILAEWKPEWNSRLGDLGPKFGAMGEDSLVSTRKIRQPIESMDDISNAFDGITYEKGAAVIRMFENWAGETEFQSGVNRYLKLHADKNATVHDFLDSISAAGQPRLTRAFSTFLEQPGFPIVSVDLKCDGAPRVALAQKRYLPVGSAGANGQTWQVPVCVRYQTSSGPRKECFLLAETAAEFPLSKASGCPAYLSANDSASGYYVAAYSPGLLRNLLEHGGDFLNAAERRTLLHDLRALASSGNLPVGEALRAVPVFASAPERQIVAEAQNVVLGIRRFVPRELETNYARYIKKAFGPRAAALGWSARPGDDQETRLLRAGVLPFVAVEGGDSELKAEARRLAEGWLKDRQGVDPDMVSKVLSTAARFGDRALFENMLAELKNTQDRHQRQSLIGALGSFGDPAIARSAMSLVLNPELDARETLHILVGPLSNPATGRLPFEFVKTHYDELVKRLPSGGGFDGGAMLPFSGGGLCDEPSRREFAAFFEERAKSFIGGPRNYAQALEGIKLCEARKASESAGIAAFLKEQ